MIININKYSDLDLALMCCAGLLGNGIQRRQKLGARYLKVQLLVNQITRGTMPAPEEISKDRVKNALFSMRPSQSDYDSFIEEVLKKI